LYLLPLLHKGSRLNPKNVSDDAGTAGGHVGDPIQL
jgi:hypothetical protein